MQKRIPFIPFQLEKAKKYSERFQGVASKLASKLPNLEKNLIQGRIDIRPQVYISLLIFSTLFWFALSTGLMTALVIITSKSLLANFTLVFLVSAPLTLMSFLYILSYPGVMAKRRMRLLERDLLFALRHGLIEVKSGVTLFNAMTSIATGGYGIVSDEFKKVVKAINVGVSEGDALEKSAFENPSLPLRKAIWQISNALKAGSDIGVTLSTLVKDLEKDQLLIIKKYGRQMNPWTMMYMMLAVIMPSMGITFLIVMSAFSGIGMGNTLFYLILVFMLFFQVFFLSFVKTKRPMIGN